MTSAMHSWHAYWRMGRLCPPLSLRNMSQALRADLRAETMSHAAGLTAHTAVLMYGKSGFLGRNESGHGRSTVGLTRARGTTIIMGPPDSQDSSGWCRLS